MVLTTVTMYPDDKHRFTIVHMALQMKKGERMNQADVIRHLLDKHFQKSRTQIERVV